MLILLLDLRFSPLELVGNPFPLFSSLPHALHLPFLSLSFRHFWNLSVWLRFGQQFRLESEFLLAFLVVVVFAGLVDLFNLLLGLVV